MYIFASALSFVPITHIYIISPKTQGIETRVPIQSLMNFKSSFNTEQFHYMTRDSDNMQDTRTNRH